MREDMRVGVGAGNMVVTLRRVRVVVAGVAVLVVLANVRLINVAIAYKRGLLETNLPSQQRWRAARVPALDQEDMPTRRA